MMILIRIELVWHKKNSFFLFNACFVFHFYIIWKIIVPEYYYNVCWVYQKAKRKKAIFLMVWYPIVSYRIGIILSVSVLYCIIKNKRYTSLLTIQCVKYSCIQPRSSCSYLNKLDFLQIQMERLFHTSLNL